MGILGVLTLIFIVLKLVGVGIVGDWSWFWVLSPLWIEASFWILLGSIAVIVKRSGKK